MKRTNFLLALSFFLFIAHGLSSQTVSLTYKKRMNAPIDVQISLSNKDGGDEIPVEQFKSGRWVYFTIKPDPQKGSQYFRGNELQFDLPLIQLEQDGKFIEPAEALKPVMTDGRATAVLMRYSKSKLDLHKEIVFKSKIGLSDPLHIPEIYLDGYDKLEAIYNSIFKLINENDYERAYEQTMETIHAAEEDSTLFQFKLFEEICNNLPPLIVEKHIDYIEASFDTTKTDTKRQQLELYDKNKILINNIFEKTAAYLDMNFKGGQKLTEYIKTKPRSIEAKEKELVMGLYEQSMLLLETSDYSNYQFGLFLKLIQNDLLSSQELYKTTHDFNLKGNIPANHVNELKLHGWFEDYTDLVYILNKRIALFTQEKLFTDKVIENLEQQADKQPQPYLEFYNAMNHRNNPHLFTQYLNEVIEKSADPWVIMYIEMIMLHPQLKLNLLNDNVIANLNKGMDALAKKQWRNASAAFDISVKQLSNFAPAWFLYGLASFGLEESYAATVRFEKALELYPDYMSPKLFILNSLYNQNNHEKLLEQAEYILTGQDIYLIHIWKAKALYKLGQHDLAIKELKEKAFDMNSKDIDAYFLLGDIYVAQKNYQLAKESYQEAQRINPFDVDVFNKKMLELQKLSE